MASYNLDLARYALQSKDTCQNHNWILKVHTLASAYGEHICAFVFYFTRAFNDLCLYSFSQRVLQFLSPRKIPPIMSPNLVVYKVHTIYPPPLLRIKVFSNL